MSGEWRSAHVHHYEADQDALILDALAPAMDRLREQGVDQVFFTRHWLRGPHVRLHVRASQQVWDDVVRPVIEETVGGYLAAHPSTARPDVAAELVVHRQLALLEQEHGELEPWFPDNSVQYLPYDRRLHVLGTPEAADLLADFHVATTPLALDVLAAVRAGGRRLAVPIDLMVVTAEIGCPPISKGFLSYRSHAEGFLANSGDPEGIRARFDEQYDSAREPLAERLEELLAALDGRGEAPGYVTDWAAVVRRFCSAAGALIDSGDLPLPNFGSFDPDEPRPVGWGEISEFHAALFGDEAIRAELATARWFAVYRVILNYQYLLLNRMGLRPVDRFMLCHLVARTVEDVFDLPIKSLLSFIAGTGRETGSVTL